MAEGEGRGGYRRPGNPAPVSGPGAMSKRTDGGPGGGGGQPIRVPTGGAYGEARNLEQLQQSAPLSDSAGGGDGPAPEGRDITAGLIGLGEPSQEPDVPVTSGSELGEGPGLDALNLPTPESEDMQALVTYLPALETMANRPGASQAARNLVRQLKSHA